MGRNIKTFSLSVSVRGREISALVILLEEGIHVSVFGGDKSHIGAVCVIDPEGICHRMQFPGHRDGVIASGWAKALSAAGYGPVTAEAGIHYNQIDPAGIDEVMAASDHLLEQVLEMLNIPAGACF